MQDLEGPSGKSQSQVGDSPGWSGFISESSSEPRQESWPTQKRAHYCSHLQGARVPPGPSETRAAMIPGWRYGGSEREGAGGSGGLKCSLPDYLRVAGLCERVRPWAVPRTPAAAGAKIGVPSQECVSPQKGLGCPKCFGESFDSYRCTRLRLGDKACGVHAWNATHPTSKTAGVSDTTWESCKVREKLASENIAPEKGMWEEPLASD